MKVFLAPGYEAVLHYCTVHLGMFSNSFSLPSLSGISSSVITTQNYDVKRDRALNYAVITYTITDPL